MTYRTRINYTPELTSHIWSRYKQGESLNAIARSIDRHSSSIYQLLSPTGGIPPRERTRSSRVLSLSEREEISRGLVANHSLRTIAKTLDRSPSVGK